jgi:hypothetical protein
MSDGRRPRARLEGALRLIAEGKRDQARELLQSLVEARAPGYVEAVIPIAREGGSEAGASRHGLSGICPTHVRHLLARLVLFLSVGSWSAQEM